jgi:hypothetical protein
VSELVTDLARVRAALARREGVAALLGAGAGALLPFGVAALAARAGLLGHGPFVPLGVWVVAAAAAAWGLRPVWRAWRTPAGAGLRETAGLVERELGLRRGAFVGAVDAATSGRAAAGTSEALRERAVDRLARALPPRAAWAPATGRRLARKVRDRAAALVIAGLGTLVAFALAPNAAAELVSPLRTLRAFLGAKVELSVSAREVRRGGSVVVTVRAPQAQDARLHVRETGETWHAVPLVPTGPDAGAARLTGIAAPLYVYASAGRAVSDTVRIGVIEPPFVAEFSVTARFPRYLEREEEALPADSGPVALPVGTVLAVRGTASAGVSEAALLAGRSRVALRAAGRDFGGDLVVRGSATWRLALADAAGEPFPAPLPVLDVRAVPDSAPRVAVPVPGADTTAPLDLRLPLVVDARDDHALARVAIVSWRVSRLGVVGARRTDTLPGVAGADHVVQSLLLDINDRGLLPGDTLRLFARATDRAPRPQTGTSREYAIRLRSLAELRDAVRATTDSLAREASDLAGDQAALSGRTEDLAAQRTRDADAARRSAEEAEARAPERTAPSAALPFEQAQEAAQVREAQQRLVERAQALRQALARAAQAAEDAGLNDPAWQQRLRELDSLLQQAITPDLQARLEELRQALERLDPQAVQDALRQLAAAQLELRRALERSAELFERAALEGSMQTFAHNAEALRQAEEQWASRAPARRDTLAAAAEQRVLRREADTLGARLEALDSRLRGRGDSASAATVERAARQVQEASQHMGEAAAAMAAARQGEARQQAGEAAKALRPVADALRQRQAQMAAGWRAEVVRLLHEAETETITLAMEEQGMADRLRRGEGSGDVSGRQSALEQGVDQVTRRLSEAAGRNALVSPRLGAALGQARRQVEASRRALTGPRADPGEAAAQAQGAAQALAAAAFQIMRTRDDVSGSQSGSGMAEALERLARLASRQGLLNDQLGGLLPLLGPAAVREAVVQQLRELAARQRGLADELERLGGQGLPGHPEQLAQEARRLADRLEQGRLDRATLERQQQLFRRMLDAGRTLRSDREEDPERRSETARAHEAYVPVGSTPRETPLKYPVPTWEQLKSLSPAERAMVLDYFRRINAAHR